MPLIKKGSSGSAVKTLQKKLNAFKHKLALDGIFGPKTDAAVRAFQKASSLKVDGLVGKNTAAALDLKTSGGGTGGKKSTGGKGVQLVDWRLAGYRDKDLRYREVFAPYPVKYKRRQKEYKAFEPFLIAHLAMSTNATGKQRKTIREKDARVHKTYKQLETHAKAYLDRLTECHKLIERYHALEKNGKIVDALRLSDEILRLDKDHKAQHTQFLNLMVDYDMAHEEQERFQAFMQKEIDAFLAK
ncbi:peptidoglycan-binding protein [Sulfitobacter sp. M57]|uniref:peptidoglycan-binding domain-containing protein n=1 Tax=unclassified Sulfitobacter TaxID=196795 RepID=UPI0023E312D3|nr:MULTISPECIES: peptidoglycan-binding domain-containing protein [unclassified Sulfitobacter]MDF3416245.1 peptidoglycan-binding protein [Sulfitobacter sp. KE5]MDF3423724.1 peptidoglycan-binding protein [Sulfitobacter sp. KE43]MDF3434791.1 peptidoglycan-binding protein [Sulfitobacter sp. KE42]MDF3460430.1 peptidoglycan-binding protein [Sulfitobacter sp. S74]MDF3464328.1 peptidoglycan-binding protein [Sulfitobacter sp. Ks18]